MMMYSAFVDILVAFHLVVMLYNNALCDSRLGRFWKISPPCGVRGE